MATSTMYVGNIPSNETVRLRSGASTSASVLVNVPFGKAVSVENYAAANTWSSVTYDGTSGYMMTKFLVAEDPFKNIEDTNFTVGHFGKTNTTQVKVRKQPNTSAGHYNNVVKGSTFLIEGVVQGTTLNGSANWVKIRYGTKSGGHQSAYVHSSFFTDIGTPASDAKSRCITIAKSLEKNTEANLGLGGDCCQQFIYWLCGACGRQVTNMPFNQYTCGPARDYFKVAGQGSWQDWTASCQPKAGDLVYYGTVKGTTSNHVGLVVAVNTANKTYTSIECNLSDKVKKCEGNYATGYCATNSKQIQGFARPLWT